MTRIASNCRQSRKLNLIVNKNHQQLKNEEFDESFDVRRFICCNFWPVFVRVGGS
jgi:hypothetical protein